MEVIKNKRVLALGGIIGLILGCIFPYFKISIFGLSESIALWDYWEGKIVLTLTLANALFIFQDFIEKYIPQLFNNWLGNLVRKAKNPKFALIPTILIVLFAVSLVLDMDISSEYIKYGLGFWVLWLGIVCLVGHAIFYKKPGVEQPVNYQSSQSIQQFQPDFTKKSCPHCGNQVDVNAEFCFMCGNKF